MKTALSKNLIKFIPVFIFIIILIGTLTDFTAEMHFSECATSMRTGESNESGDADEAGHICTPLLATPRTFTDDSTISVTLNSSHSLNTPVTSTISTAPSTTNSSNGANNSSNTNSTNRLSNPVSSHINPLTGLTTASDISQKRPVAVSISNQRAALPTNAVNGISQADIVYEVLVEGGVTRFIALYQDISNVGVIGSIRSARHYTVEIVEAYDAIFIHAGGSPLGYEEIERRGITNLDEVTGRRAQIFRRDTKRIPGQTVENYHSVITSGANVTQWFPTYGFRLTHSSSRQTLSFTDTPIPTGERAHKAVVRFSSGKSSTFTYNQAQNTYSMSQFGSQFTDANNGNPVAFTNLLILEIPITDLVGHGGGSGRQDMNTVGSGTGYFVSGGRYVKINWFRADKTSPFIYTLENGSEIELGRGRTYIGIVPPGMSTTFS